MRYEGSGETMIWNGKILVGYGYRNTKNVIDYLASQFEMEVIGFELKNPEFYHIDTVFFPINDGLIAVYADAFTE